MFRTSPPLGAGECRVILLPTGQLIAGLPIPSCLISKGHWCRVLKAYPVKELQTEDDRINVEMDPEDDFKIRQLIDSDNLR